MSGKPTLEPISNEPLKKMLMKRLSQYIWQDLEDGDKLPTEKELADQLQVGRSSIRETLRSIEALGLVEVRRGSGYFVTKSTGNIIRGPIEMLLARESQPLSEIIEARTVFEMAIVGLIVERIRDEEIAEAQHMVDEIQENLSDSNRVLASDRKFHQLLYQASRNSVIYHVYDLVSEVIKNIPGNYLKSEAYMQETTAIITRFFRP